VTDRAFYTVIYRGPSEADVVRRYRDHATRMAERGVRAISEQRSHGTRETIIAVTYQQVPLAVADSTAPSREPTRTRAPKRGPW
jgi:hypothetical protein